MLCTIRAVSTMDLDSYAMHLNSRSPSEIELEESKLLPWIYINLNRLLTIKTFFKFYNMDLGVYKPKEASIYLFADGFFQQLCVIFITKNQ